MSKYFNYDYTKQEYYEVSMPYHDHYTYDPKTDAWYEDILMEDDLK